MFFINALAMLEARDSAQVSWSIDVWCVDLLFFFFSYLSLIVFAVNFRVKAAMKSSVLLTWESRTTTNKAQSLIVSTAKYSTLLHVCESMSLVLLKQLMCEKVRDVVLKLFDSKSHHEIKTCMTNGFIRMGLYNRSFSIVCGKYKLTILCSTS